jgi:hypothetical protein
MSTKLVAALLVVVAPLAASAAGWAGKGKVSYTLVHKFHEVVGKCDAVEARALPDAGGLKIMARAPVKCFDSGDGNRDAHALEVLEAGVYPMVVVKGVARDFQLPATPGLFTVPVDAEVELHGRKVTQRIDLVLDKKSDGKLDGTFEFPISLEAFKIERPSLLFVKVDDAVKIKGRVELEETK